MKTTAKPPSWPVTAALAVGNPFIYTKRQFAVLQICVAFLMYGALDLSAPARPPKSHRDVGRHLEPLMRKEVAAQDRWAQSNKALPLPPYNYGSLIGIPSDIERLSQGRKALRASQSLPEIVRDPLPGRAGEDGSTSTALPSLGAINRAVPLPPVPPARGSASAAEGDERVPTRERNWRSAMAAAEEGRAPDPLKLYCLRKHCRRFQSGGMFEQTGTLDGFSAIAKSNVRICSVVNGYPVMRQRIGAPMR